MRKRLLGFSHFSWSLPRFPVLFCFFSRASLRREDDLGLQWLALVRIIWEIIPKPLISSGKSPVFEAEMPASKPG
jgi:hypothetical protein